MSSQLLAEQFATVLHEEKTRARILIDLTIKALGQKAARNLLTQAIQTETDGGMMTKDNDRRRTPGGVFFQLARVAIKEKGLSWNRMAKKAKKAAKLQDAD
ncbi:MAG: phosphorylated adapter RNA export RNA-binding domain-containing protein [Chloroflexota bacterium]